MSLIVSFSHWLPGNSQSVCMFHQLTFTKGGCPQPLVLTTVTDVFSTCITLTSRPIIVSHSNKQKKIPLWRSNRKTGITGKQPLDQYTMARERSLPSSCLKHHQVVTMAPQTNKTHKHNIKVTDAPTVDHGLSRAVIKSDWHGPSPPSLC